MAQAEKTPPKIEAIPVSRKDLPLSCPRRGEPVWDKHPRVFLLFDAEGEAVCPYCSTRYALTD